MAGLADFGEFALAFTAFLASHRIPSSARMRDKLVGRLGGGGFTLAYSALSILLLAWVFEAAARAPYVGLWETGTRLAHVTLTAMVLSFLLAALSLGRPNPFSFGGAQNARFDPQRPGIIRLTRHPLLLALMLWSGGHLLANGDLVHVILFGSFALFAGGGMRLLDRRAKRQMGARWVETLQEVRSVPLSFVFRPARPQALRAVFALAAIAGVLALHPLLFGVDPWGAYFMP